MRLSIFNDCVIPAHNKRSSTDRFPASARLAAVDTYRYLSFDQLSQYTEKADGVIFQTAV
ncbi:aconitate hydratase [Salmonella enterica]|uniref:Aconitate hydratase n=3 Tax=Salmonella enterica TaxID=28901 RepID=A0A5V1GUA2_SALER|nr:hypothetical protein [Salmonella enterica]EAB8045364.1 aconitate hydratase [Salmonella enterica subsp. enterica serovar Tees]EBX8649597.1 aconitate hydratase [Salmonella enterica subsp. enterica serovar Westhampton]ECU9077159.1 aconitate hydratase [Salmonella enterica subsp. enterica serovar O rough]ECZ3650745.1 aconitate hydratase [Salmonella enterica subsp. enterica serovar Chailey]EDQ0197884.1 aconitate hydratase [Salmonella enterica subsp. enterica serovar Fresno]EDQ4688151.1 aconitate